MLTSLQHGDLRRDLVLRELWQNSPLFSTAFSARSRGTGQRSTFGKGKARLCGLFLLCAEADSNLHPVIPDQALNIAGQAVGGCRMVL